MKVTVIFTGKSEKGFVSEGISRYEKRIRKYVPLEILTVTIPSNVRGRENQMSREGEAILSRITPQSYVVLLDEKGDDVSSVAFAEKINFWMQQRTRKLVFVIGGPFGFSAEVRKRAQQFLSLSSMTFSHQVVRILFMEQLYRAFTILRGEPYHHE